MAGPWNDQEARSIVDWWVRSAAAQTYDVIFTELADASFDQLALRYAVSHPAAGDDSALFDRLFSMFHAADWV